MSYENDIGYIRKGICCIDKELLTFLFDTAVCGVSLLKKRELKQGHTDGDIMEIRRIERLIYKRRLKEHGLLSVAI